MLEKAHHIFKSSYKKYNFIPNVIFINNFKLNFIKDLQRMPQLKLTVKNPRHSPNLENDDFRLTNSFGGQGI